MTVLGEAKITVTVDTKGTRQQLDAVDEEERKIRRKNRGERDREEREDKKAADGQVRAAGAKAKSVAGRIKRKVSGMRSSTAIMATVAAGIAAIPFVGPALALPIRAANLMESHGPAAAAVSLALLDRYLPDDLLGADREKFMSAMVSMSSEIAGLKARVDAAFGAAKDAAQVGKAALMLRKMIDPAEMARVYGDLYEIQRVLKMAESDQRQMMKRVYASGLAEAISGSLQE